MNGIYPDYTGPTLEARRVSLYPDWTNIDSVQPPVGYLPSDVCARGLWERDVRALGVAANPDELAPGAVALNIQSAGELEMDECAPGLYRPDIEAEGSTAPEDVTAPGLYAPDVNADGDIGGCD